MQGSKCYQPRIFYRVSLEQLVPEDHLVRQLAKLLHGMARARWRGLAKVLMQVLLTATVLNIKKLLVAITRLAKGAVAAVKSANVCCAALIIDVFVSAEYILSIRRACRDKDYRSVWALRC